jgi:hypothetical protein
MSRPRDLAPSAASIRQRRRRDKLRGANVTPKDRQMPDADVTSNVTLDDSANVTDVNVTAEASTEVEANVTPAPAAPTPPNPLPPGTITVTLDLSPAAVDALRTAGFLAAGPASTNEIAAAVFAMLGAAWRAGIGADRAETTPSPHDAEEAARQAWQQKMAAMNALS